MTEKEVAPESGEDSVFEDAEVEENTVRKDFTVTEIAAIYKHLKEPLEEEAQQRQQATQPEKGQKGFQCAAKLAAHKGETRDKIATRREGGLG